MFWILVLAALIAIGYLVGVRRYKFWTDRGVIQGSPYPIVGDNWGVFTGVSSFAHFVEYVYEIAPNSRYGGMYQFLTPVLVLKDNELIKQICVKDFDHFTDHRPFVPEEIDPLMGKSLFALQGQKWRDMRATLSPAFTSSKMKQMFGLMTEIAEQFVQHFLEKDENLITVELKDNITRYANDVIASTAFGVKCDSLQDRDNEFYLMGKEATDFQGFGKTVKIFGLFLLPRLFKFLNMSFFTQNVANFFKNLVKDNIRNREKHGIIRPDLIQLLMEARTKGLKYEEAPSVSDAGFAMVEESDIGKTGTKQPLTDLDITAQALVFFFAGFDTVSALMCFMCHEMAVNPDIQERLREEVDEIDEECGGKLTYEALLSMKYMDMVTSESLRKWPNTVAVDRVCTKPYIIKAERPGEVDVKIEEGMVLLLPLLGLHRDPKYFPEPERFDPERFNEENKHKILPYSYVPFGAGPRSCVASRFALLETKTLIFNILKHYEIVPVEKTQIPLRISKTTLNMTAENGFWLGLKKRNIAKK